MQLRAFVPIVLAVTLCACAGIAPPASSAPVPVGSSSSSPSVLPTAPSVLIPTTVPLPTEVEVSSPVAGVVWAFVGGSLLFRSRDGGATWEQRPLPSVGPGPNGGAAFGSDQDGLVLQVGSPATQCMAQGARMWRTSDAGATWMQVPEVRSNIGLTASAGIEVGQCKGPLSFVDAKRGFVGAVDRNSAPMIYRTTDGGVSWSPSQRLPDPAGFRTQVGFTLGVGAVHAVGSTLLLQASGSNLNTAGTASTVQNFVFRSTDGGATWMPLAAVPSDVPVSVAFVTATRWLRLIAPGQSVETTDAGVSWHAYASDYGQAAPVPPVVVFADANVGYATVRGSIQRTVDGGAHWVPIRTPGTN